MLVKYKENKPLSNGYTRDRKSLRFELIENNKGRVKLKGRCENGTPWFEYANLDEIEELKSV